jgi:HSP20 family molecular chaperone IbpA
MKFSLELCVPGMTRDDFTVEVDEGDLVVSRKRGRTQGQGGKLPAQGIFIQLVQSTVSLTR